MVGRGNGRYCYGKGLRRAGASTGIGRNGNGSGLRGSHIGGIKIDIARARSPQANSSIGVGPVQGWIARRYKIDHNRIARANRLIQRVGQYRSRIDGDGKRARYPWTGAKLGCNRNIRNLLGCHIGAGKTDISDARCAQTYSRVVVGPAIRYPHRCTGKSYIHRRASTNRYIGGLVGAWNRRNRNCKCLRQTGATAGIGCNGNGSGLRGGHIGCIKIDISCAGSPQANGGIGVGPVQGWVARRYKIDYNRIARTNSLIQRVGQHRGWVDGDGKRARYPRTDAKLGC